MKRPLLAVVALVVATQAGCAPRGGILESATQRQTTGITMMALGAAATLYGVMQLAEGKDQAEEDRANGFGGLMDAGGDLRMLWGLAAVTGGLAALVGGGVHMAEPRTPGSSSPRAAAAPWPIRMRPPATPSRRVASGGSR